MLLDTFYLETENWKEIHLSPIVETNKKDYTILPGSSLIVYLHLRISLSFREQRSNLCS